MKNGQQRFGWFGRKMRSKARERERERERERKEAADPSRMDERYLAHSRARCGSAAVLQPIRPRGRAYVRGILMTRGKRVVVFNFRKKTLSRVADVSA